MQRDALRWLVCPRRTGTRACHGSLRLERVLTTWAEDPQDLLEGILRCARCRAEYPIVCGIPILHHDTPKYLRNHYHFLVGSGRALGCLSDSLRAALLQQVLLDLRKPEEELFPAQPKYTREGRLDFLTQVGPYLCNHYDNLAEVVPPADPLYGVLQRYPGRNPHVVLERFAAKHHHGHGGLAGRAGLAVDIGCHVGGFLAKQAQRCRLVFGVDLSFENLLLAGRILRGRPTHLTRYRLYREGTRYTWRTLNASPVPNVEFVVASGTHLPFKPDTFDMVSSCNVVDIVPEPLTLVDEKLRVLKTGGLLLTSDPYQFYGVLMERLKPYRHKSPLAIIKDRIARETEILEEEDYVPWVTHNYNRHYLIYHNHCLAAIKKGRQPRVDGGTASAQTAR